MTPDRFAVMVATLAGMPPPPPPALPGRVYRAPIPDGRDPVAEQWDAEHGVQPAGWEGRP